MKRIVIVGSGNMASALALALKKIDLTPIQIFARNATQGRNLAELCGCEYASQADELAAADLYIIAVSDMAIESVSSRLDFGDAVVAHTAASVEMNKLSPRIIDCAVFYPLQTFTKGRDVNFREIPILVEGATPKALKCVREVAVALSDNVKEVDSQQRLMVHVAAVFAGNFTNYMYTVGEELVTQAGMDFSILKPLILETTAKAVEASSPGEVQTGPAIRNDYITKSLHCDLLAERSALRNIYINLSNNIWETSKKISQK